MFFKELLYNYALVCAFIAWFAAQFIKLVLCLMKEKKLDFTKMVSSGGMPSSHSAAVCSLSAAIYRIEGARSALFAAAIVFSFIVMYDAANVRRYSGEHARLLNIIVTDLFAGKPLPGKELKELIGHTPIEVIAGACLGVFVPLMIRI